MAVSAASLTRYSDHDTAPTNRSGPSCVVRLRQWRAWWAVSEPSEQQRDNVLGVYLAAGLPYALFDTLI